jgi:hypothetical protein
VPWNPQCDGLDFHWCHRRNKIGQLISLLISSHPLAMASPAALLFSLRGNTLWLQVKMHRGKIDLAGYWGCHKYVPIESIGCRGAIGMLF